MFKTELKQLMRIGLGIATAFILTHYGKLIFTEKGGLWASIVMLCLVLALAIKIYYRIMVIKYYEKDTHIRLFENR